MTVREKNWFDKFCLPVYDRYILDSLENKCGLGINTVVKGLVDDCSVCAAFKEQLIRDTLMLLSYSNKFKLSMNFDEIQ